MYIAWGCPVLIVSQNLLVLTCTPKPKPKCNQINKKAKCLSLSIHVDVELGVCEQTLELNALIFFRKPKLNNSDSDKPIFKLSK